MVEDGKKGGETSRRREERGQTWCHRWERRRGAGRGSAAAAGKNKQGGAGPKAGLKAKESDKEKEKNIKSRENEKITPPKGEEGRGRLLRRGWGRQE